MRYLLVGQLQYSHSHDNSKNKLFVEYFDADNLETAIVIARAMVQSHKIKNEREANHTERLEAILRDVNGKDVWKTNLVPEKTRTRTEVITPEHFAEEIVSS